MERERLKDLLLSGRYEILALPEILKVKTQDDVMRLEDIAILVIKKYTDLFYRKYAKRFETGNLNYNNVGKQMVLPFVSEKGEKYVLQIKKKDEKGKPINRDLINKIKELKRNLNKLLKEESEELPRVYLDSHLYLPILVQSTKIDKISPEELVESEADFVKELKEYLKRNKERFRNYKIYLLRNFPKIGVGFQLQWSGFYPDFIMWITNGKKQIMVFVDPKGLVHTKGLDDEKVVFAGFKSSDSDAITIKDIEKKLGKENVVL
ncbi:MAG: restriction endonuclease subunit R, partial [bacterium]